MNKFQDVEINYSISDRRVLVIDEDGRKLGEFMRNDAIRLAEDKSLDLVKVSNSGVPTCKIMDYGKFIYDQKKKAKASKAGASSFKTKEIRMSPRIADADMNIRVSRIKEFANKGHSIKITMRFRGTDMRHIDIGRRRCDDIITACSDFAKVEEYPRMNGRQMVFLLSPK